MLVRKRVLGRCKLQDKYENFPYVVVGPAHSDAEGITYKLQSVFGDEERIIHRENLRVLECDELGDCEVNDSDSSNSDSENSDSSDNVPKVVCRRSARLKEKAKSQEIQHYPVDKLSKNVSGAFNPVNCTINFNYNLM